MAALVAEARPAVTSTPLSRAPFRPRWARRILVMGLVLGAAVAAVIAFAPLPESFWVPDPSVRSIDARLARIPRHRPLRDVPLDRAMPTRPNLAGVLLLSLRGDSLGLAEAHLARGDLDMAETYLAEATPGTDASVTAAVLAWLREERGRALDLLDQTIVEEPSHAPGWWNRALVLEQLGLAMMAASAFDRVAALGEPGWAEEARNRAEQLRKPVKEEADLWYADWDRAKDMVGAQTPLPAPEDVGRHPGMWRAVLYDALRTHQDREQLKRLHPVARALDQRAERESNKIPPDLLVSYVSGTAPLDAARDPWLALVAAEESAKALMSSGRYVEAEERLRSAKSQCPDVVLAFRCASLEIRLAEVYSHLHLPELAQEHAQQAWQLARGIQEWGLQLKALQHLGQIARLRRELPLMRAYLEETRARASGSRPELCAIRNTVRELLASEYLLRLRPDDAARELAPDPACDSKEEMSLFRAMVLVGIARQRGDTTELDRHRSEIEALRDHPDLTPGERLMARYFAAEGARLRGDPSALAELEGLIREADGLPAGDVNARKTRAYAFASMIREAGLQKAHQQVIERIAAERAIKPPDRCVLVVDAQDETLAIAGRDGAGQLFGSYRAGHIAPVEDVRHLVPDTLVSRVRRCPAVDVLARAPVNGRAGLLPPEIAWSYRLSSRPITQGPLHPGRRLIVTAVQPPPHLKLARLNDWDARGDDTPDTVRLEGLSATPSRVLEQMKDATEIRIHAHGRSGTDLSDASIIALSPDAGGKYALLAKDVRAQRLERGPIVMLGACNAAKSAPYPHEPLSLPAAFIDAGARVVLAPAVKVPDVSQAEFFEAVLSRIRAGQLPAVAARDERMEWARRGEDAAWTRDVLVFE